MRRNIANPIGVGKDEMRKIISTPFGKHPLDKYIREENLPLPKRNKDNEGGKAIPDVAKAMLYLRKTLLPRSLFGSSTKTAKSDGSTAEVRVIYLQPHTKSSEPMPKGRPFEKYAPNFNKLAECDRLYPITVEMPKRKRNPDTCPFAGECSKVCLIASGQLGKEDAHFAGYMKTWLWFLHPVVFLRQLILECKKEGKRSAKYGYDFYARLNGTSDIPWEKYIEMDKMVKDFVGLKGFYDYTKWTYKARIKSAKLGGKLPKHYDLTFSMSEAEEITGGKYSSEAEAAEWLAQGGRVAVVVQEYQRFPDTGEKGKIVKNVKIKSGATKGKYKKEYWAITDYSDLAKHSANAPIANNRVHPLIIDGDQSDFRFNDPPHSIIILKPKGIYVDEQGRVYVTDSAYSEGRKYLTPKSRAFIKSAEYVLNLQDRILHSLGKGETIAAKNPRKKGRSEFTGNYEEWKSIAEKLEKDVDKASVKLQKMLKGKKGAMGLLPESLQKSPAYKKAKAEFDKAFFSSQQFQISVPLKKRKQFQNKRSQEYRKAKWGISNPRNNPLKLINPTKMDDYTKELKKLKPKARFKGEFQGALQSAWFYAKKNKKPMYIFMRSRYMTTYWDVDHKNIRESFHENIGWVVFSVSPTGVITRWEVEGREWMRKNTHPQLRGFDEIMRQHDEDTGFWVGFSISKEDVIAIREDEDGYYKVSMKRFIDMVGKDYDHEEWDRHEEGNPTHWLTHEEWKKLLPKPYKFPSSGEQIYQDLNNNPSPDLLDVLQEAISKGNTPFQESKLLTDALEKHTGHPTQGFKLEQELEIPQEKGKPSILNFYLYPSAPFGNDLFHLVLSTGNDNQGRVSLVADITGFENLNQSQKDNLESLVKAFSDKHGRPPLFIQKAKLPSRLRDLLEIDAEMFDLYAPMIDQRVKELDGKRGNYVQVILWVFALAPMVWDGGKYLLGLLKKDKKSASPMKEKKKNPINPQSKRWTLETFSQKYWGDDYLDVPLRTRKEFWSDFRFAFNGSLKKYMEETTEYGNNPKKNPEYVSRSTRLMTPMGSKGDAADIAGVAGYRYEGMDIGLYLYDLEPWYRDLILGIFKDENVRLKKGEKLFRYRSHATHYVDPESAYLIKVNVDRDLLYFMTKEGSEKDIPEFQTRGIKLKYLTLYTHDNPRKKPYLGKIYSPKDSIWQTWVPSEHLWKRFPDSKKLDKSSQERREELEKELRIWLNKTSKNWKNLKFKEVLMPDFFIHSYRKPKMDWSHSKNKWVPVPNKYESYTEYSGAVLIYTFDEIEGKKKIPHSLEILFVLAPKVQIDHVDGVDKMLQHDINGEPAKRGAYIWSIDNPTIKRNPDDSIPQEVHEKIHYFSQTDQGKLFYRSDARYELVQMMEGSKDPDSMYRQERHYKGWKPEHFRMLIKGVDKALVPECKKKVIAKVIDVVEEYGKCERRNPREFEPQQAFDKMFGVLSQASSKKLAKKDLKDSWVEKKFILEKSKVTLGDDLPKR